MKTKYMKVAKGKQCGLIGGNFPSFSGTGSVRGIKDKFYGKHALLVRCGSYIYNVTSTPSIYEQAD